MLRISAGLASRPRDLIGKTVYELFGDSLSASLQPHLDRVLSGEAAAFEADYPGDASGPRTLQVTYTPDLDEHGDVQGFVVLGSDTTARKKAELQLTESERRQAALVALGDQLRDLKDLPSLTAAAMEIAGTTLDVARTGYGQVDASGEYVTIIHDWTNGRVSTMTGTYRFGDFGEQLGLRLQQGELIAIPDVATHPITATEGERWNTLNVKAVINVPLIENGRLVAVLFIQDSRPRFWTEADLTFVRKVADRTWTAAERTRTLQELQESEEFTRSILASSPDCVKVVDLDGRLLSINEGGCRQMEIEDPSLYLSQPWADFWGQTKDTADQALRAARVGRTTRFEGFCPTAAGTPKWWEVIVTPVRDVSGKPVRILSISRDITERQSAEQERTRLTRELTRSNEDLSQFAHIVAHDLQSPLRGVMSFAQLLQRDTPGRPAAQNAEFLGHIVESAQRMQELVQALLRFAQVGQGEIDRQPVEMEDVLNVALRGLQVQIQEQDARITHGFLPTVIGDGVQLSQLLQNLIGNALKYCRPAQPPVISVHAASEPALYLFAIKDNGQGIAPEHLNRVFEPLKRLHGAEIPGSGLGLAVCQRIVNRHGGRIWVESEPGIGSTFYFTLPRE